jgi:septal ring factor EnvC (AmiA/AmiB activator)
MARLQVIMTIVGLLILCFIGSWAVAEKNAADIDSAISSRKTELEKIQTQIKEKQSKLANLEKEEKGQLEKLNAIEEELGLANQLIVKIDRQMAALSIDLGDMEFQLNSNLDELRRRQQIMDERLVWIYKRSRFSPLYSAFGAEDILTGARRVYYFSLLNRYDKNMLKELIELNSVVENDKDALIKRQVMIFRLKTDKEQQLENIKSNYKKRRTLLTQVRRQRNAQKQSIQDLLESQQRITGILDNLAIRKAQSTLESGVFDKLKGKLIWPVEGKIIQRFGKIVDERYSTSIINAGIDIKAKAGTPVVAASAGEIAYVSWLRGYGSFVIIDHGSGYYTLYAQLDEIPVEAGQQVEAGQMLGIVSEIGTLSETSVHFEIRQGKEQLDPTLWLR